MQRVSEAGGAVSGMAREGRTSCSLPVLYGSLKGFLLNCRLGLDGVW